MKEIREYKNQGLKFDPVCKLLQMQKLADATSTMSN